MDKTKILKQKRIVYFIKILIIQVKNKHTKIFEDFFRF